MENADSGREALYAQMTTLSCAHCAREFRVLKKPKKKVVFCSDACGQLELIRKKLKYAFHWAKGKKALEEDEDG